MKGKYLGEFEEIVMLTVGVLFDEAYGIAIKETIETRLNRRVGLGALHSTLGTAGRKRLSRFPIR